MPDKERLIGKQLGNYRVIRWIDGGGYGDVYEGEHMLFGDTAAIKVSRVQNTSSKRNQIIAEARLLRFLKHPYILPILDAGEAISDFDHQQGLLYMVMEFAPGGSLRKKLDQQLPMEQALNMLWQIGQALHYAHQPYQQREPVVHRDLKPENILLNARGDALLADFGLAAFLPLAKTRRIDKGGTYDYMAPEQFDGDVSVKSDQYALGCIAYELLTGQRPFKVDTVLPGHALVVWAYQHKQVAPKAPKEINPRLPVYMSDAILKALAKDREDRHENVLAFVEILRHGPGAVRLPSQPKSFTEWYILGNEFYEQTKYQEAISAYQRVIRMIPHFADAYVNVGLAQCKLKKYQEAIASFNQALDRDSHHIKAHLHKGIALAELGSHLEAAEAYEQVVQIDANHKTAYRYLGEEYDELGRYSEAVYAYKRAIGLNPYTKLSVTTLVDNPNSRLEDAEIYTILGIALKNSGETKEGLAAFDCAIRLNPRLQQAHYNKGNLLSQIQQNKDALDAFDVALSIQPDYTLALNARRQTQSQLDKFRGM